MPNYSGWHACALASGLGGRRTARMARRAKWPSGPWRLVAGGFVVAVSLWSISGLALSRSCNSVGERPFVPHAGPTEA